MHARGHQLKDDSIVPVVFDGEKHEVERQGLADVMQACGCRIARHCEIGRDGDYLCFFIVFVFTKGYQRSNV